MRSGARLFTPTASITSEAGHGENLNEIDMKLYKAPDSQQDQMYLEVNMGLTPVEIDDEVIENIVESCNEYKRKVSPEMVSKAIMNLLKGEQ